MRRSSPLLVSFRWSGPCFDMRSEMDLGLLGHPRGFAERRHQVARARYELTGVTDAVTTVVAVPTCGHRPTLHQERGPEGAGDQPASTLRSSRASRSGSTRKSH